MTDRFDQTPHRLLAVALLALGACVPAKLDLFDSDSDPGTTGATATSSSSSTTTAESDPTTAVATLGPTSSGTTGDDEPPACGEPINDCKWDEDHDGFADLCDNAPRWTNPDQADSDEDGFGDISDLCPTLPSDNNTADTDRDGIGNDCDYCTRPVTTYNGDAEIPEYMKVRNIPWAGDSDHDGIGDACDNCIWTPNCEGYGDGLDPYELGDPIAFDNESVCQVDENGDRIGDACAGTMRPGAAGPVGFLPTDDFDQDGLPNTADTCPRQPVTLHTCVGDGECPEGGGCTNGVCNHLDSDKDGVGDICDTCPWNANPKQIQAGAAEEDDADGDFVGNICETDPLCRELPDARRIGFYDASVNGYCCVQLLKTDTVLDPDGNMVPVPPKVLAAPGVGALPPGCTDEAQPIDPNLGLAAMWAGLCLMPQWDQDFDGVGDQCDLCPFAFDPAQEPYIDEDDVVWPNDGKYCHGEYDPSNLDPAMMCLPGT